MKKLICILAIVGLLSGCAAINQFLCSPDASQTEAANVGLALAQAALIAASTFTGGGPVVAALSSQAVPVFKKVVEGYCVAQIDWNAAVDALQGAQTTKVINPAIAMLQKVKWAR